MPKPGQVFGDHPVIAVGQFARGHAFGVGLHLDRGAVFVGAADHQHVVASHPVVPGEHVAGQPESGDVPNMTRTIGIWPGRRGQDVTFGWMTWTQA